MEDRGQLNKESWVQTAGKVDILRLLELCLDVILREEVWQRLVRTAVREECAVESTRDCDGQSSRLTLILFKSAGIHPK